MRSCPRDERAPVTARTLHQPFGGAPGFVAHGGGEVSRGQKFVAMSLLTFILLIVIGAAWGHHNPGDPTGDKTASALSNYTATTGNQVPINTQAGINQLATDTGHLAVSINFSWTLMTGFLVLFMQVRL